MDSLTLYYKLNNLRQKKIIRSNNLSLDYMRFLVKNKKVIPLALYINNKKIQPKNPMFPLTNPFYNK